MALIDEPRADLGGLLKPRADGRASLDLLVPDARCAGCMARIFSSDRLKGWSSE